MGYSARKIFVLLHTLKITQCFVECVKQCYEAGDVVNCPKQGWLHLAHTIKVVEVAWSQINRNPCCKQKILVQK